MPDCLSRSEFTEAFDALLRDREEAIRRQERHRCAALVAAQMESSVDRCGTALRHILRPDAAYDNDAMAGASLEELAERMQENKRARLQQIAGTYGGPDWEELRQEIIDA